jgi:hypothetical protein
MSLLQNPFRLGSKVSRKNGWMILAQVLFVVLVVDGRRRSTVDADVVGNSRRRTGIVIIVIKYY